MNITLALEYGYPGKFWTCKDNDYEQLTWDATVNGMPKPTLAQLQTAYDAYVAAQATIQSQTNTLVNNIKQTAQSAVGVTLNNLTAAQRNALIAILLYKAGGVNISDGTVKALNDWV